SRTKRISCRGRLQDLHAARNQDLGPGQLHPLVRWRLSFRKAGVSMLPPTPVRGLFPSWRQRPLPLSCAFSRPNGTPDVGNRETTLLRRAALALRASLAESVRRQLSHLLFANLGRPRKSQ